MPSHVGTPRTSLFILNLASTRYPDRRGEQDIRIRIQTLAKVGFASVVGYFLTGPILDSVRVNRKCSGRCSIMSESLCLVRRCFFVFCYRLLARKHSLLVKRGPLECILCAWLESHRDRKAMLDKVKGYPSCMPFDEGFPDILCITDKGAFSGSRLALESVFKLFE